MKKNLFLTATLLFAIALGTVAQNYTKYSFSHVTFPDDSGTEMNVYGYFSKVSNNGKYAVGTCVDQALPNVAYMWSSENPKTLTNINSTANRISAFDVTNDGMIVGSYENRSNMTEEDVMYPAYRTTDGVWHKLPVHKNASTYFMTNNIEFTNSARAVTPDGKYIAGQGHLVVGKTWVEAMGKESDVTALIPYLWERNGDSYKMTAFDNLTNNSLYYNADIKGFYQKHDSVNVEFVVYDISNDGKTIVGVNFAASGGQNPAFIRNGKLYQFFDCGEEDTPNSERNFNGGTILSIDSNGNMYGYYSYYKNPDDEYPTDIYFQYTAKGKFIELDKMTIGATADGTVLTRDCGLYSPLSISDSGNTIAGGGVASVYGGMTNAPEILHDATVQTQGSNAKLINVKMAKYATVGKAVSFSGEVQNIGETMVDKVSVEIYANGKKIYSEDIKNLNLKPMSQKSFTLDNVKFDSEGDHEVYMTISKVNDIDDTDPSDNTSATAKVICRKSFTQRNVLLEVFSTEACSNCPNAHSYINKELANQTNIIEVGHHAGYYTDPLTIQASLDYEWFYSDQLFAPAMMIDRTYRGAEYPATFTYGTPILDVGTVLTPLCNLAKETPAEVELIIDATYDAATSKLTLNVEGKEILDLINDEQTALTVFLTEDSILTTNQNGAAGEYYHRHAVRFCLTPSWGDKLGNIQEGFKKTYTAEIPNTMDGSKMEVVAFVNNYDTSNKNNCRVYNAVALDLKTIVPTGITEVNADKVENNVYYNLQGIRVDKPTKGLYIQNGKKVLFK